MNNFYPKDIDIIQTADDFMIIEILNPEYQHQSLDYCITNNKERKIFRKGCFKGQMIQLRLSQLIEGNYTFNLFKGGEALFSMPFVKKGRLMTQPA